MRRPRLNTITTGNVVHHYLSVPFSPSLFPTSQTRRITTHESQQGSRGGGSNHHHRRASSAKIPKQWCSPKQRNRHFFASAVRTSTPHRHPPLLPLHSKLEQSGALTQNGHTPMILSSPEPCSPHVLHSFTPGHERGERGGFRDDDRVQHTKQAHPR